MSEEKATCPICKRDEDIKISHLSKNMASYECPVCGKYEAPSIWPTACPIKTPDRKLSAWIREQNDQGKHPELTDEGIEILQASIPDYKPSEKQIKLLKAIERRSAAPGDKVTLNLEEDFSLAYADSLREFNFYLQALTRRNLVEMPSDRVKITSDGWDYLDKHASDLEEKTQGFVAMSFSPEMKSMWEKAIKPAIQQAGYTACRVDEQPHNDNIIFKIMAEIKNSRFVVADVTEQRNGVYFEAGYALGLGVPVIWSVRKDDAANVHFDTAQYNQIRWETPEELREGLFDYICAIIGKRN